jgi:hypothetical protein
LRHGNRRCGHGAVPGRRAARLRACSPTASPRASARAWAAGAGPARPGAAGPGPTRTGSAARRRSGGHLALAGSVRPRPGRSSRARRAGSGPSRTRRDRAGGAHARHRAGGRCRGAVLGG